MSRAKRKVKVLRRDPERRFFVELEIDGKNVRIEKFTEEDIKAWDEHIRKEGLEILALNTGYVDFDYSSGFEGAWEKICQRKALAVYRLLWYFGPPYLFAVGDEASCDYRVKYKGYVFEITDEPGKFIEIRSLHLVTREEFRRLETVDQVKKEEYKPPEEIKEEIVSMLEYLMKNSVEVYTNGGPVMV